jgi:hypothetical protein
VAVVSVEEEEAALAAVVVEEDVVVEVVVMVVEADNAGLRYIKFKCQAVDDDLTNSAKMCMYSCSVKRCENDSYHSPVSVTSRCSLFVILFSK